MATNWIFSYNTFEVNTRDNFKKMLSLSEDHYGKLVAVAVNSPNFVPLRDDYAPLYNAYKNIYAAWQGAEGTHEGSTVSVEEMLTLLNTEIRKWEGTVRYIFPEDTPNERSIFPNKRAPFQTGTYEQRISAVKTLAEKLATFTTQPLLVTLSGEVASYYNTIETTRLAQTGDELGISQQRAFLEDQRKRCAVGMYGNLGRIMYLLRETPVDVQAFWDMSLLRDTAAPVYKEEMTINPASVVAAALSSEQLDEVDAATPVVLKNNSPAPVALKVGFSSAANEAPPFFIIIEQNNERELSASELGWSSAKKYLVVQNETTETGTLSLEIDI